MPTIKIEYVFCKLKTIELSCLLIRWMMVERYIKNNDICLGNSIDKNTSKCFYFVIRNENEEV